MQSMSAKVRVLRRGTLKPALLGTFVNLLRLTSLPLAVVDVSFLHSTIHQCLEKYLVHRIWNSYMLKEVYGE